MTADWLRSNVTRHSPRDIHSSLNHCLRLSSHLPYIKSLNFNFAFTPSPLHDSFESPRYPSSIQGACCSIKSIASRDGDHSAVLRTLPREQVSQLCEFMRPPRVQAVLLRRRFWRRINMCSNVNTFLAASAKHLLTRSTT